MQSIAFAGLVVAESVAAAAAAATRPSPLLSAEAEAKVDDALLSSSSSSSFQVSCQVPSSSSVCANDYCSRRVSVRLCTRHF